MLEMQKSIKMQTATKYSVKAISWNYLSYVESYTYSMQHAARVDSRMINATLATIWHWIFFYVSIHASVYIFVVNPHWKLVINTHTTTKRLPLPLVTLRAGRKVSATHARLPTTVCGARKSKNLHFPYSQRCDVPEMIKLQLCWGNFSCDNQTLFAACVCVLISFGWTIKNFSISYYFSLQQMKASLCFGKSSHQFKPKFL